MSEYHQYFEQLVTEFLGDRPSERKGDKLRFGTHGSMSVDLANGTWYDHENEIGGGPLDLIIKYRGGSVADAIAWLEDQGIKPKSEKPKPSSSKRLIATYDYADENGEIIYQVMRYEPKTFRQRAADGSWSIKGVTQLPYLLPNMLAKQESTVIIVEGEKDALSLQSIGMVATCNSGGAGKFHDDLVKWFKDRRVVIIPDNDDAGKNHAQLVAKKLYGCAKSIRILHIPVSNDKDDVSDWIANGGTRQALIDLAKSADEYEPRLAPQPITKTAVSLPNYICDYYSPLPLSNDKGKPLKHIENLAEINNRLRVTVRYNVIKKEEEILIPNESFSVDNEANASFAWLLSECSRFDYPTDKLGDFLTYLSDKNLYNPVAQWVMSKPWDGVSRLTDLYNTITPRDMSTNWLKEALIRRWLISAIGAAFSPDGIAAGGVLTLQGVQNLGKTKWLKKLAPDELGLIKDGMILRPDDKDSVKQVCSFWLVELGELDATFRKSDMAALKAFITSKSDVLRRVYARKESHFARRTVFFASVNPLEFLHDSTGNRRYWTIECSHINHEHTIDMQQVWAEVKHTLWDNGVSHYLSHDELEALNEQNENHMAIDPIEERIMSGLAWNEPETLWRWVSATDVLIEIGVDRPTKMDVNACAGLIRKRNGGRDKRSNGKRLLLCPNHAFSAQQ